MSDHAEQLFEHLEHVEGGHEVIAARIRELDTDLASGEGTGRGNGEEDTGPSHAVVIRRGAGELPASFWDLTRPDDPEGSVRRAVEEDRR